MYTQDSFFDLSPLGQVGLACLSLGLAVFTIWSAARVLRNRHIALRIIGALAFLWLFVWLTPQAYYQYYRVLIEDLPQQLVIRTPKTPVYLFQILSFQGPQNLSAHSQGILGWCLLIVPFLRRPRIDTGS